MNKTWKIVAVAGLSICLMRALLGAAPAPLPGDSAWDDAPRSAPAAGVHNIAIVDGSGHPGDCGWD